MDTDIDTREITIQVRCTQCKDILTLTICRESLSDYTANGDGTYTALQEECARCVGA